MSFPLQRILNNSFTRPETPIPTPSGSEASSPASNEASTPSTGVPSRTRRLRDCSDLTFTIPSGPIKYPAYENKDDEASMRLMQPFNINTCTLGGIQDHSALVPYSSDKKDLKTKTGREKLEIFVYQFTDPNDKKTYEVMWDFKCGLVRISPFFKNQQHKKTGPAKMLDANPGMRDVTIQITGGNRITQGYWIHMYCARAVCASFCYPIRGALIPIFGRTFPNDCIKPGQPGFGIMTIDAKYIREAQSEVKAYRMTGRSLGTPTSHPHGCVEDQYAGSPMDHRVQHRPAETPLYPPPVSWGPSPPYNYGPGPSYPRPTEYNDSRSTPQRELGIQLPRLNTTYGGEFNARPESSGSEAHNVSVYPNLAAVPRRTEMLQPSIEFPGRMIGGPPAPEPYMRLNKRRLSLDGHEAKRCRKGSDPGCSSRAASPYSVPEDNTLAPMIDPMLRQEALTHDSSMSATPEDNNLPPIDPNLGQETEQHVVNEPVPSPGSSSRSTPAQPVRFYGHLQAAECLLILKYTEGK